MTCGPRAGTAVTVVDKVWRGWPWGWGWLLSSRACFLTGEHFPAHWNLSKSLPGELVGRSSVGAPTSGLSGLVHSAANPSSYEHPYKGYISLLAGCGSLQGCLQCPGLSLLPACDPGRGTEMPRGPEMASAGVAGHGD